MSEIPLGERLLQAETILAELRSPHHSLDPASVLRQTAIHLAEQAVRECQQAIEQDALRRLGPKPSNTSVEVANSRAAHAAEKARRDSKPRPPGI